MYSDPCGRVGQATSCRSVPANALSAKDGKDKIMWHCSINNTLKAAEPAAPLPGPPQLTQPSTRPSSLPILLPAPKSPSIPTSPEHPITVLDLECATSLSPYRYLNPLGSFG